MKTPRLNIGLFVCHLENEYSSDIIKGASLAAEKLDVNLFVLPVRYIDARYHDPMKAKYEYQFSTLISYAATESLDAIIFEAGTIGCFISKQKLKSILAGFSRIPVITLSEEVEGYPCMRHSSNALREEINHLIHVHGKKRIAFIGGPETNEDAIQRYQIYREVLEENNIPYDPLLYGAGDFTEYCTNVVKKVFEDTKGDVDAICFANDRMAIAGYEVLSEYNLVPGKDIAVAGFDDAPCATAINPTLTTVRSDITALGYRAVEECLNIVKSKSCGKLLVDTSLIIRPSCGCSTVSVSVIDKLLDKSANIGFTEKELFDCLREIIFDGYTSDPYITSQIELIMDFYHKLYFFAVSQLKINYELLISEFSKLMEQIDYDIVSYDKFTYTLDMLRQAIKHDIQNQSRIEEINELYITFMKMLSESVHSRNFSTIRSLKKNIKLSNSIFDNALVYLSDDDESIKSIIRTLKKLNIGDSFIFLHERPVVYNRDGEWKRPKFERLIACQSSSGEGEESVEKEGVVDTAYIFRNDFYNDVRSTFVVSPLFFNDEHYGLIMCSLPPSLYTYFSWVIQAQISYALKMRRLMNEQSVIQKHLQRNIEKIKSSNAMLKQISKSDELTGVYNRRGFMELTQEEIFNHNNVDRNAVIVYADMDNLKIINDRFGHDDGDYALVTSSMILKRCFRSTDIIARIGGDEFAVFAFTNIPDFASIFQKRLNDIIELFNKNTDKPYYISLSAGICEFLCSPDVSLQHMMNEADEKLYKAKRGKRTNVMKE